MNRNKEQIIKALEICANEELDTCKDCPYAEDYTNCNVLITKDALAIIKAPDQKIFELENRIKENENGYEQTLFLERCKNKDLTEQIEEMAKDMCACCRKYVTNGTCEDALCVGVLRHSEALYNAGYRKERQGKWLVRGLLHYERRTCFINHAIRCSNCGFDIEMLQGKRYIYCPHCGARMKGGE